MSEAKKMKLEIHHEKREAERNNRKEERELRKTVEMETEELKSLADKN